MFNLIKAKNSCFQLRRKFVFTVRLSYAMRSSDYCLTQIINCTNKFQIRSTFHEEEIYNLKKGWLGKINVYRKHPFQIKSVYLLLRLRVVR
jgi:hypothetical protein